MRLAFAAALAVLVGACRPTVAPVPVSAPAMGPVARRAVPENWHLLDLATDSVLGIGILRAERELLAGRQPQRTVVVAVIDNGVDTAHVALRPRLWTNPRETPGNGVDDDNDGLIDDVRGWNLIGGPDGRNVNQDTYEVTRLAALCADPAKRTSIPAPYNTQCAEIQSEFGRRRTEAVQTLETVRQIEFTLAQITPILRQATGTQRLTVENVTAVRPASNEVRQARSIFLQMAAQGITDDEIADAKKAFTNQLEYSFNLNFDPRPIVGDNYPDTTINRYGNPDVTGPDPEHGTHVAGIIGAIRDGGGTGIAQSVRIMAIRSVPDGDERDKDVANAIRFAVDHGANIINMSFGKGYSPYKGLVDEAVRYADSRGVLMVHAAGNDGENTVEKPSFPTPAYTTGGRAQNWIEVGASSWKGRDSLVADFSNYGTTTVDLFAPGVDIYSAIPGGGFKKNSGTSMASPVVAGVAALLMSYFPTLTAADVKRILLESSTRLPDVLVVPPGGGKTPVRFGDLSATGGVLNAYNAIRMAQQRQ